MAGKIKQYYDIKFPFTSNNEDGFFIDLNKSIKDKVASQIAHLILTNKGTRLRKPDFGTNLTRYIFEQNDSLTWENVENDIKENVSKYIPNANINEVVVVRDTTNDNTILIDVKYSVNTGRGVEGYRMAIKL
jgi:phage baseplate assembly protein W